MRSTHYPKQKSPGVTILRILGVMLLIAIAIVSVSGPALAKLDEWGKNPWHQLATILALLSIIVIRWIYWRAKR